MHPVSDAARVFQAFKSSVIAASSVSPDLISSMPHSSHFMRASHSPSGLHLVATLTNPLSPHKGHDLTPLLMVSLLWFEPAERGTAIPPTPALDTVSRYSVAAFRYAAMLRERVFVKQLLLVEPMPFAINTWWFHYASPDFAPQNGHSSTTRDWALLSQ